MQEEHILQYERLGLGSRTHSRDAELWALLTAMNLLHRNPPPSRIREVVLVSDAALALGQLRSPWPTPGHSIMEQWHLAARALLSSNPQLHLTVCWGPSKSSLSMVTVDELAKRSRTTGGSPLVSLRTQRMNLRNTSLQEWRQYVLAKDLEAADTRMSQPYPVPNRDPPYWLALPRVIQARLCQLLTGRATIQRFLHIVDKDTYRPFCPLEDGPGTLDHYLQHCRASSRWRSYFMDAEGVDEFPSTPYLLDAYMPTVLLLLDHSALGTRTFQKERGVTLTNPTAKFWSTDHTPLTKALSAWDLTPLQDPSKPPPPPRMGPDTELTVTQSCYA